MRLIDADALFIAVDIGETDVWQVDAEGWGTGGYSTDAMKSIIEKAPTIDAVPVCRCKDCKHWEEIKHGQGWCTGFAPSDVFSDFDDFCSYGERKDGGG